MSDEDIDIEEHDLLENPAIRNMFPDLSILKQEKEDSDNEGPAIIPQFIFKPLKEEDQNAFNNYNAADTVYKSPKKEKSNINEIPLHRNKIILGTKPNKPQQLVYEDVFEQKTKLMEGYVQLHDLGPYLQKSERYCDQCSILFPSRITYENHKEYVHLEPRDSYLIEKRSEPFCQISNATVEKSNQCTNLNEKLVHKKVTVNKTGLGRKQTWECERCNKTFFHGSNYYRHRNEVACTKANDKTADVKLPARKEKLCSHCNIKFPNEKALIDHMYSMLQEQKLTNTPKAKPTDKCSASKMSSVASINSKVSSAKKKILKPPQFKDRNTPCRMRLDKTSESNRSYVNKKDLAYRCPECSYYCVTAANCAVHLKTKHNILRLAETLKPSPFNPKCIHCSGVYTTKHSFNMHMHRLHRNVLFTYLKKRSKGRKNKFLTKEKVECEKKDDSNPTYGNKNDLVYKCPECSYCFITADRCVAHLNTKHNVVRLAKTLRKIPFNPKCVHCSGIYSTKQSYNMHLNKSHKNVLDKYFESKKPIQRKNEIMTKENIVCERKDYSNSMQQKNPKQRKSPKCIRPGKSAPCLTETKHGMSEEINSPTQYLTVNECAEKVFEDAMPDNSGQQEVEGEHSNISTYVTTGSHPEGVPLESQSAEVSFALKATLFKCNKCDIYFVSAKVAIDHIGHMELLINWKCMKCFRIFKKEDEESHEKQHLISNDYIVHDVNLNGLSVLSNVLYKCVNCAGHFTDKCFSYHFTQCGIKKQDLIYCKWCDILIDRTTSQAHEICHVDGKIKDLLIVEADIVTVPDIADESQKSSISIQGTKRKSCSNSSDLPSKKANLNTMLNMCYCDTCKCYLTESHKRDVHIESRCWHMVKYVCKFCGLILTAKSYQTHKNLHSMVENLKLQDFNFFDMRSGEKIRPPIPHYPMCGNCEVHFASKTASTSHECSADVHLTCHICDIKLSEVAFKLHMPFHTFYDLNDDVVHKKYGNSKKNVEVACDDNTNREIMTNNVGKNTIISSDKNEKKILKSDAKNDKDITATKALKVEKPMSTNDCILFSCKRCEVTTNTYDGVVEHCQWHYGSQQNQIPTKRCNFCNSIFEISCYDDHQKWHQEHKNTIKFLYFDTCYFKSRNDIWLKHLFGSLSTEKIKEILGDSMYKSECRVKLKVVQDGHPDLTVFKCDQCQCFIEDCSLYKHSENSCFKLRKHPCSFCGLQFISSLTRIEHEKIHKNREITLQSYRIIIFNREEDKSFNQKLSSHTKYVFYQCRNCNCVLADKSRVKCHTCNEHELEKCMKCGLLFDSSDYTTHIMKHEEIPEFVVNNMKVILVGVKGAHNSADQHVDSASFKGIMKDYTFYSCMECQTCFQTLRMTYEHVCSFANRAKCPDCSLHFYSSKIKTHRKLHEIDLDFIKENMQIITTEPRNSSSTSKATNESHVTTENTTNKNKTDIEHKNPEQPSTEFFEKLSNRTRRTRNVLSVSKTETAISTQALQQSDDKTTSAVPYVATHNDDHTAVEQTATIYKCYCGLHFLDKLSITSHMKVCNLRIKAMRQKCAKCGLKFTPNILFSHLLQHHGNKQVVYKFHVIEPTEMNEEIERESTTSYHKCSKCRTHFVVEEAARNHLRVCDGGSTKGKLCDVCNILFDPESFTVHQKSCKRNQIDHSVISISETSSDISDGIIRDSDRTIYKCKQCNIHYLTVKSIQLHISKNNEHFNKLQDICNVCGLNFVSTILAQHIYVHHEKINLKPNEFIVKEY